jgi:hypothetical protein
MQAILAAYARFTGANAAIAPVITNLGEATEHSIGLC